MGNVIDFTDIRPLIRSVQFHNGHIDTENDICFEYGMSPYFFLMLFFYSRIDEGA